MDYPSFSIEGARRFFLLAPLIYAAYIVILAHRSGRRARDTARRTPPAPPERWPAVTLIIPAWKEHGTVEILMRQLRALDYPAWDAVVVAGGSDGTYQAAQAAAADDPQIKVIEQQPRGKNAALNDAMRLASGEVIVILDADAQVDPGWLRALVGPIQGKVSATTGNYLPLRTTPFSLHGQMEKINTYQIRGHVFLQGSGGIALRREVIEAIGGFPEDVLVGVDWDLDARVAMAGYTRVYCPDATVYTERPATLPEWWENELRWRRAHLASAFRLSTHFLASPRMALATLYPYIVAWLCVGVTLLALIAFRQTAMKTNGLELAFWATALIWTGISRLRMAVVVATYTGSPQWLRLIWTPVLLWYVTLAASFVATLSMRAMTMHFKGPRHNIEHTPMAPQ
jgi:cellulose synthase/poly-beta-1,6-N-acetylglucosamine synthase-like glycosyltransferase